MKYTAEMSSAAAAAIAAAIRRARLEKGLSTTTVAERVGVSQPTVSRFELGSQNITLEGAVALAEAVGLEIVASPRGAEPLSESDQALIASFTRLLRHASDEDKEIYGLEFSLREKHLAARRAAQK